jgi:hypothetical protein
MHVLLKMRASRAFEQTQENLQMLESIVDVLGGLLLSALTYETGSGIGGWIVAALRALSRRVEKGRREI